MIIEPAKSSLISWQICFGIAPIPDQIYAEINRYKAETFSTQSGNGEKVIMTETDINTIKAKIIPMLDRKMSFIAIYQNLINTDALPKTKNGKVVSYSTIVKIIRNNFNIPSRRRNIAGTAEIAYKMRNDGYSNEDIAKKLNVKPSTVSNILSLHKKLNGLPKDREKGNIKLCYELKQSGMTIDEISKKLKLKHITVSNNISKHKRILTERY